MIIALKDENKRQGTLNFITIESADVRPEKDDFVMSLSVAGGEWHLYRIDGLLCGYFEEDME